MEQYNSIFDGAIKGELSFTELFRNFLRFSLFRQGFLELLQLDFDKSKIDFEDFEMQHFIGKNGRPDLVLFNEEVKIYFEIKVNDSWLTNNQPTGYYRELNADPVKLKKALILIAPLNYIGLNTYKEILETIKGESDAIVTQILYWEDIAVIIEKRGLNELSPLFSEYASFLRRWFQLSYHLNYDNTKIMFNKSFPESLHKMMKVIDGIYSAFEKLGYQVSFSKTPFWDEYGFYFSINEEEFLYFGIWFDYWEKTGKPICVSMEDASENSIDLFKTSIIKAGLNPITYLDECPVTYFNESIFVEKDCQKKITDILRIIAQDIGVILPVS